MKFLSLTCRMIPGSLDSAEEDWGCGCDCVALFRLLFPACCDEGEGDGAAAPCVLASAWLASASLSEETTATFRLARLRGAGPPPPPKGSTWDDIGLRGRGDGLVTSTT